MTDTSRRIPAVALLAFGLCASGAVLAQPTSTIINPGAFGWKGFREPASTTLSLSAGTYVGEVRPITGSTPPTLAMWTGSAWIDLIATGSQGPQGDPGLDGKTVRNGSGAPSSGLGVDGDFYIDTAAIAVYGPKASGTWGSPTSLIGPTGAAGATGADGATWTSGTSVPAGGTDNDFYLRSSTGDVYNKAAGSWSIIANITGPAGANGADGATGATGATGPAGPAPSGAANQVLATPNGTSGTASLRALGLGDLPAVDLAHLAGVCTGPSRIVEWDGSGAASCVATPTAGTSGVTMRLVSGTPSFSGITTIEVGDNGILTNPSAGVARLVTYITGPADVPTAVLWVEADSLAAGGAVDGDRVSSIADLSSAGGHTMTAAGTARPTYKVDMINGRPALQFDGVANCLTNGSVALSSFSIFVVFAATNGQVIYEHSPNTNANDGSYLFAGNNNTIFVKRSQSSGREVTPVSHNVTAANWGGDDQWHLVLHSFGGTYRSHRLWVDGAWPLSVNTGSAGPLTGTVTAPIFLGCRNNASNYLNGLVAAFIVITPKLPRAQEEQVIQYLRVKYF